MKVRLPIYVYARKDPDQGGMGYSCAPLFEQDFICFDVSLPRAMSKLAKRYKPRLDRLGEMSNHRALQRALYFPDLNSRVLKLRLELDSRLERIRLLFVTFQRFGRWLAFTPSVPELCFEIDAEHELNERATEVLTDYYREQLRFAKRENRDIKIPRLTGQAWVASVDLDIGVRQKFTASEINRFAMLWENEEVSGATELHRVGRCLDWLYPDNLKRAVLRDDEIHRLEAALRDESFRPVAIVGPRLCGKTSVLHETIRRVVAERKNPYTNRRGHWLISPQRLISGMSYVGQWESRLLAIIRESRRRGHVLCFDNFLGLFEAGKSSCSELSVADVLRNHILRRRVRVLSELTSEQWAAFQERDRGLADQFHVLRIEPTNDDDTLRIMVHERRQLESEFKCRFALDAIPAIWEIHRRYDRAAAFPGNAAGFMRRIAAKSHDRTVAAQDVYRVFSAATGVSPGLLNGSRLLTRDQVRAQLSRRIIGQNGGVEAAADAVMVAKAGLNDPSKPIATLLFLGPTGVGKTQCAKALAQTMFSDDSRLIRFDMNEYGTHTGATRLIGSRRDPDGLLAAAVRRQPYAVILLDEIEKAHRDVFDLLLQVLGEGRLTDSRGRTADFTNTVIVMTSNLGVRESAKGIGLRQDMGRSHGFERAARKFFRPEFFNRIDRIVPFSQLSRSEMGEIARLAISELLGREGLLSRRTAVHIDAKAMNYLVERGYHSQLGARALKRTVESFLGQPVARRLANITRETPTMLTVQRRERGIETAVYPLVAIDAQTRPELPPTSDIVDRLDAFYVRMRKELETIRPQGAVSAGELTTEQLRYFSLQEQLRNGEDHLQRLQLASENVGRTPKTLPPSKPMTRPRRLDGWNAHEPSLHERRASYQIEEFHADLNEQSKQPPGALLADAAIHQAALLHAMVESASDPERLLVLIRSLVMSPKKASEVLGLRLRTTLEGLGYNCEELPVGHIQGAGDLPFVGRVLSCSGTGIETLLQHELGTHTIESPNGALLPFSVELLAAAAGCELDALARHEMRRAREIWRFKSNLGERQQWDPQKPLPVVRHFRDRQHVLDFRSGRQFEWREFNNRHLEITLGNLPWPKELAGEGGEDAGGIDTGSAHDLGED